MTKIFKLKGLDCANCAAKIERGLSKIKGIEEANVDFMTTKLFIDAPNFNDELFEQVKSVILKTDSHITIQGA